jgi:hypothetical protein
VDAVTTLSMYVIYERPRDWPESFVVREWVQHRPEVPKPEPGTLAIAIIPPAEPGKIVAVRDTLEHARAAVPAGTVNVGREPDDDPKIVEVWL